MDRLSQLRGEAGGSRDSTLDTTSQPSEAYITANESCSKFYSLSEVDSTFDVSSMKEDDITSIKDGTLASTTMESDGTLAQAEELISNLSPISKKSEILENYKIDSEIESVNILTGVAIFDDNDNSYDGHELVIDDNIEIDEKSNPEKLPESLHYKAEENEIPSLMNEEADIASKDTEVVLQIDGKNVDALPIGNGLYLYRKAGHQELAAVQIIDDGQQQPSFKFLKVRDNAEGNLEVYEEIEVKVKKEVPAKEGKLSNKNIASHVPIMDINKVINDSTSNKVVERKIKSPKEESTSAAVVEELDNNEASPDGKTEVNFNGKMMKFSESRKSPVIGSFTPMTYHSTPNKEGVPLTKTMVDQQLHPNRHFDVSNIKKTIEVHTDSSKQKTNETPTKSKEHEDNKLNEVTSSDKETIIVEKIEKDIIVVKDRDTDIVNVHPNSYVSIDSMKPQEEHTDVKIMTKDSPIEQDSAIDSTENEVITKEKTEENIQTDSVNKEDCLIIENKGDEIIESKKAIDENVQQSATKPDDVCLKGYREPESTTGENKSEPLEEDETELKIVETETNIENNIKSSENNTQAEQTEISIVEKISDKSQSDVNKQILPIDDAVSNVKKTVVESDENKGNTKCETKLESHIIDTTKCADEIPTLSKSNTVDKEMTLGNKEDKFEKKTHADSKSVMETDKAQPKMDTIKVPSNLENDLGEDMTISAAIVKESNKDTGVSPVQNESIKDIQPSSSSENQNKNTEFLKEKEESIVNKTKVIINPKVTDDKQKNISGEGIASKEPTVSDAIANISPLLEKTIKHAIPANITPLLEKRQQSTVAPQVIQEKPIPPAKTEYKNLSSHTPNVVTVNKTVDQRLDGKLHDLSPRQNTEPAQLQLKDKVINESIDLKDKRTALPVRITQLEKPQSVPDMKPTITKQKAEKEDDKMPSKDTVEKAKSVPKLGTTLLSVQTKQDVTSTSTSILPAVLEQKDKEAVKLAETKPLNNNHAAVPFGKWTDANRQEFLNKFKTKSSVASSTSNQLKNSNDLNRRDVLKKIDSQRQSNSLALSKNQESNKLTMKTENAAFTNKPNIISKDSTQESKIPQKTETVDSKTKPIVPKNDTQLDVVPKAIKEKSQTSTVVTDPKKEVCQRTGVVQNLIDKTIEGMIHRNAPTSKSQDEKKQNITNEEKSAPKLIKPQPNYDKHEEQDQYFAIEMKMNELHGIPFIERPPHELPQVYNVVQKVEPKIHSKIEKEKPSAPSKTKIPNLLPFPTKNQQKLGKDNVIEVDSEDEIIEHEPITGDIDLTKKNHEVKPAKEKLLSNTNLQIPQNKSSADLKKEAIITEKDFEKFARRNSITYENCLTVNFDGKPHNVVQTVVEKDQSTKNIQKNESVRVDSKAKLPYKYQNARSNNPGAKNSLPSGNKFVPSNDDANRNQSKLQKAYQSALTAKRQLTTDCPITIIEDKPVKVVFMDNVDYAPSQLNVQGQDLSPCKKTVMESDLTVSTCDSLDSDVLDNIDDAKSPGEIKTKTKHQRKQVLTPVEEPELELIEPKDLGLEVSPKKKRKTEDSKSDKNLKYPMRKKLYLLSASTATEEKVINPVEVTKNPLKETVIHNDNAVHKNTPSALDSLVKAAELIETQTENINSNITLNSDNQANTPVKRGRGRPRKYPRSPDGAVDKNSLVSPSPQKRPRLIDAKAPKRDTITDDSDSDEGIIKENWTMGKINENIVCPICNKLFRTENVVFKHVKHCTGPSPNRSDSDKRSPRRMRISLDFDSKSRDSQSDDMDMDDDKPLITRKEREPLKRRKSKDSTKSDHKDDIIVIEDTPIKTKSESEKGEERKPHEPRKSRTKIPHRSSDLVCEFCGKTFRQLSYLVSHKLQHKKTEKAEPKILEKKASIVSNSVYSCEVCKKEFRKLHHLVQHRIIHNPTSIPTRSRKSSSEHSESKTDKEPSISKQSDDLSAGFRCEPCDKSFRKLHHLVEHRETHDGINRQKTTTATPSKEEKFIDKPITLYECDVCKKTFRKLQHLSEHREQHAETSSEKSDDKSVKSALSTKDIIHECSLCYMVFPNEHSLNKHTIICRRKKRQSKQTKPADETEDGEVTESLPEEKTEDIHSSKPTDDDDSKNDGDKREITEKEELFGDASVAMVPEKVLEKKTMAPVQVVEKVEPSENEETAPEPEVQPTKRDFRDIEPIQAEVKTEVPEKIKKIEQKEPAKIPETPKRKTPLKDKTASVKRFKTIVASSSVSENINPTMDSSDDDEVRYMLNPNFKADDVSEEKMFKKVRAKKRSSLQIERPNSKDLVKRRTSLQHPPKIPRLKPKAIQPNRVTDKKELKTPKLKTVPSTDSDDSETTKYSFPTIPEKLTKPVQGRTPKDSEKKIQKKTLAEKRKSLSGIAKRKSLGKAVTARHKPSPLKTVKKRTIDVEHRCDCGQLFSSAALLSRHTTLAHTPPRIRRRRSPPPEIKPIIKPVPRKSTAAEKPKTSPALTKKTSARSDSSTNAKSNKTEKPVNKSLDKATKTLTDSKKTKPDNSEAVSSVKPWRSSAHRGVPVPEKMKKLLQKNK